MIEDIISAIAQIQRSIKGVNKAYDNNPEKLTELPCFVNYPASGEIDRSPNVRWVKHLVKMQLYVSERVNLPDEEANVRPFLQRVLDKFDTNLLLSDTATLSGVTRYDYGAMSYAGKLYLGISFDLEVWERQITTFTE